LNNTSDHQPPLDNRVTRLLDIDYPTLQAPMSWITRALLDAAGSQSVGTGIVDVLASELNVTISKFLRILARTDKPFGVNIPYLFVRDENLVYSW
jgi:enoyl-[acyl-carrier protein] reductase II